MSETLKWVKARASGGQGGNCVETATLPDTTRLVRDSKDPDGPRLAVTAGTWREFMANAKSGKLDLPGQ